MTFKHLIEVLREHYNNYLEEKEEKRRLENLDPENIKLFLEENCPLAWNNLIKGRIFFRGTNYNKLFFKLSSPSYRRHKNIVSVLADNFLPSWEGYPKRNQSFICHSKLSEVYIYDYQYIVLPIGDPIIGLKPWIDESTGVITNKEQLKFESKEAFMLWFFDGKNRKISTDSIREFLQEKGQDHINFLNSHLSPNNLGYDLLPYSKLGRVYNREVWFSGSAYFINFDFIRKKLNLKHVL